MNREINKELRKKQFSREIENLNLDISDDSDEDIGIQFREKLDEDQSKKQEEEEKRLYNQVAKMELLEIVEQNEK